MKAPWSCVFGFVMLGGDKGEDTKEGCKGNADDFDDAKDMLKI